jgi:hypothetical protein
MSITDYDKLTCAVRELGFRQRTYARLVANGKMSQAQADHQIAVMKAIADDYQKRSAQVEPQLFPNDAA